METDKSERTGRGSIVIGCCVAGCVLGLVAGRVLDVTILQPRDGADTAESWQHWGLVSGAVIGAVLPLLVVAIMWARGALRRRHARQVADAGAKLGLEHSYEPLPPLRGLDVLDILHVPSYHRCRLENHLYGQYKSLPVDMVEFTFETGDDEFSETIEQTVVVFSVETSELPVFRMGPQVGSKLMRSVFGEVGTVFWEQGDKPLLKGDREADRKPHRFHDHYELIWGYSPAQKRRMEDADLAAGVEAAESEGEVRRLFDERLLQFFIDNLGWHLESSGQRLAVWRRGRLVPPGELGDYLCSALEVADQLTGSWRRPMATSERQREIDVVTGTEEKARANIRLVSAVVGAIVGLAISFGVASAAVRTMNEQPDASSFSSSSGLFAVTLLVGSVVGAAAGMVVGAKGIIPVFRSRRPRH
jgi:hypothetical protein